MGRYRTFRSLPDTSPTNQPPSAPMRSIRPLDHSFHGVHQGSMGPPRGPPYAAPHGTPHGGHGTLNQPHELPSRAPPSMPQSHGQLIQSIPMHSSRTSSNSLNPTTTGCQQILEHIKQCQVCQRVYRRDNHLLISIIVILIMLVFFLLSKLIG
jgi:hypothetical protein